jgi:Icc-related predicted phosphoesterase
MDDYIGRHAPRLLVHGHQHLNAETVVGGTRVVGAFGSMVMTV